jgi:hypothetical protein
VAGEVVALDIQPGNVEFCRQRFAGHENIDWVANPHSRNFMSKELFAHYAFNEGFQVVHQEIRGWGGIDDLDCITLLHLAV